MDVQNDNIITITPRILLNPPILQDIEVTENGEYTADGSADAIGKVTVNVEPQPVLEELTVTENGEYEPSEEVNGFSKVTVNVPTYDEPLFIEIVKPQFEAVVDLPVEFEWNCTNIKDGELIHYCLFVDDELVYNGILTKFIMNTMRTDGRTHTCNVIAKSDTRSGFTNKTEFVLPASYIYGFDIDETNDSPDGAVTYTDDCELFTPASLGENGVFNYGSWETFVDSICRPVMLKSDGTVDYELNHSNQMYKIDGTIADDVNNPDYDGNVMVEFNKIYMKLWKDGTTVKCRFSDIKIDSDYKALAFTNESGDEQDYMYLSSFPCCKNGNKFKSYVKNTPTDNEALTDTFENVYTYVRNNGNGYTSLSMSAVNLLQMLMILITKSRNTRESFGYSRYNAYQYGYTPGYFVDKPCFYGFKNSDSLGFKAFYLENIYGFMPIFVEGAIVEDNNLYYRYTPPYLMTKDTSYRLISRFNTTLKSSTLMTLQIKNNMAFPESDLSGATNVNKGYGSSIYISNSNSKMYIRTNKANEWNVPQNGMFNMYVNTIGANVNGRLLYIRPTE